MYKPHKKSIEKGENFSALVNSTIGDFSYEVRVEFLLAKGMDADAKGGLDPELSSVTSETFVNGEDVTYDYLGRQMRDVIQNICPNGMEGERAVRGMSSEEFLSNFSDMIAILLDMGFDVKYESRPTATFGKQAMYSIRISDIFDAVCFRDELGMYE